MCLCVWLSFTSFMSFFLLFHFESRFKLLLIFPNQSTRINTRTQDYTFQLVMLIFSSWNILWVFFINFLEAFLVDKKSLDTLIKLAIKSYFNHLLFLFLSRVKLILFDEKWSLRKEENFCFMF